MFTNQSRTQLNELELGGFYGSLKHLAPGKVIKRGASTSYQKSLTFHGLFCQFIITYCDGTSCCGLEERQLGRFQKWRSKSKDKMNQYSHNCNCLHLLIHRPFQNRLQLLFCLSKIGQLHFQLIPTQQNTRKEILGNIASNVTMLTTGQSHRELRSLLSRHWVKSFICIIHFIFLTNLMKLVLSLSFLFLFIFIQCYLYFYLKNIKNTKMLIKNPPLIITNIEKEKNKNPLLLSSHIFHLLHFHSQSSCS